MTEIVTRAAPLPGRRRHIPPTTDLSYGASVISLKNQGVSCRQTGQFKFKGMKVNVTLSVSFVCRDARSAVTTNTDHNVQILQIDFVQ